MFNSSFLLAQRLLGIFWKDFLFYMALTVGSVCVKCLLTSCPLEKEMVTHSSILAWGIPWTGGAWWAAVHGVAQSRTRLKRLGGGGGGGGGGSSSSSNKNKQQ